MPFYDYHCTRCDTTVELLHGIEDEMKRTHEGCGGALERQYSATSVHFKGSGWAKMERRESSTSTSAPAAPAQSSPLAPAAKPAAGGE